MASRIKSCFISAPAGSNLDTLREALTKRGIQIVAPQESAAGTSWPSEIARLLSEVDLVIGVLTRDRRSNWVLFELGQAFATNQRILLLATSKDTVDVPFDLKGVLTVRASLNNREAIEFALDQLLAAPVRKSRSEPQPKRGRGLRYHADAFLQETNKAVQQNQGSDLERIVQRALIESGVEAFSAEPMSDRGVDLAIWSDALQSSVGNPVLVEVKTRVSGREDARHAAAQLSKQILSSGTRWGLLLYGEGPSSKVLQQAMPPNVLAISLTELFERMRHATFAEIVNDLRNRRVHGVAD